MDLREQPFPQAVDAERALLGGLLQQPDQLLAVSEVVKPEDFYRPEHAALLELLVEMHGRGETIDLVIVSDRVARQGQAQRYGGIAYVTELPEHVPSTANLPHYAQVIKDKSILRDIIRSARGVAEDAYLQPDDVGELVDRAAKDFATIGQGRGRRTWHQISLIVDQELRRIEELSEKGGTTTGATTGFVDLDKKLAGLHSTDLLILAARPGMGKTALALNIAQNVALLEGLPVALFSLEMSRGQLVTRMLCCYGLVEAGRVRTGTLDTDDWDRFIEASEALRKTHVHIDDTPGLSIGDL
ncbi:MAG: DnaB-like helicase C-terminal domain-containing protein, partial [Myxococcota bacterium]